MSTIKIAPFLYNENQKTGGGEGLGTKLLLYAHNIGTARGGRWGGCIVVGGRTGRGEGEGEEGMGREGGVR